MATYSGNFGFDHQNDAGFRAWISEVTTRLAAVGLVQTADTGQIDTVTVTRPGTSTYAGYQIWRFNDAMQATAPVFLKIQYGTGGTTTRMAFALQVGKGSNGSGSITDEIFADRAISTVLGTSTGTTRQSLYTHSDGFAAMIISLDGATTGLSMGGFLLARTSASDGSADGTGLALIYANASSILFFAKFQHARYNPLWVGVAATPGSNTISPFAWLPGSRGNSRVYAGDTYIFPAFIHAERFIRPTNAVVVAMVADTTYLSPFTVTALGSTSRTYIPISRQLGQIAASGSSGTDNDNDGLGAVGCIAWE